MVDEDKVVVYHPVFNFFSSAVEVCICTNPLLVHHILLECPITTALFNKDGYDFTSCNSVTDVCNTDVIIPIAKLIVRSPVGKLL